MSDTANTFTSMSPELKDAYKRERFKRIQQLVNRIPSSIKDPTKLTDEEIIQRHLEEEKQKEDSYNEFKRRQLMNDSQF